MPSQEYTQKWLLRLGSSHYQQYAAKIFNQLKVLPNGRLDIIINASHEKIFRKIYCLHCANCCKSLPALIQERDIKRISKSLHLTETIFRQEYIRIDDDGDMVIKATPCPFLQTDNTCKIYHCRPESCATYPHTQGVKMRRLLNLMHKNTAVCPAVLAIAEDIGSAQENST
jgi:uncharacterized protein